MGHEGVKIAGREPVWLDDLVRQGKVNFVAFSDSPAYIVAEANTRAELMRLVTFHRNAGTLLVA